MGIVCPDIQYVEMQLFPGVLDLVLKISEGVIHNFVEFQGVKLCFLWSFQGWRENLKISEFFKKSMSSTPPVWFFSGIAHSWLNQWSQHSFIVLKSSKSNFYAITKILEVNLVLVVLLQNFDQILVQYLNFLVRANFVSPNYWSHSLLYNFEGLKFLNPVPLESYYKSIYI